MRAPSASEAAESTDREAGTLHTPSPQGRDDDESLPSGTMLGDYRVEGFIARGGMGVVYAAVHPVIGKRAAVKILKRELCRKASEIERFVDEARVEPDRTPEHRRRVRMRPDTRWPQLLRHEMTAGRDPPRAHRAVAARPRRDP